MSICSARTLVVCSTVLCVLAGRAFCADEVNLLGAWHFDQAALIDSSPHNWPAVNNGAKFDPDGFLGGCFAFDGTSDLRLNAPILTGDPVTVQFVTKPYGLVVTHESPHFNIVGNDKFNYGGHGIGIDQHFQLVLNQCCGGPGWTPGVVIPSAHWTHITVAFEPERMLLLTNGCFCGSFAHASSCGKSGGEQFVRVARRNDLRDERFIGLVDELMIWSGVQTSMFMRMEVEALVTQVKVKKNGTKSKIKLKHCRISLAPYLQLGWGLGIADAEGRLLDGPRQLIANKRATVWKHRTKKNAIVTYQAKKGMLKYKVWRALPEDCCIMLVPPGN